jgi:hypothetical protein
MAACRGSEPSRPPGQPAVAPAAATDDDHTAELAELRRFEDERRARTDFSSLPSGSEVLGSDPYQLRPIGDGSLVVGILRGASAVVLLDRRGRELARAPTPPSPTALAVDASGRVWVGGTGSNVIASYRASRAGLARAGEIELDGAWTARALVAEGAWLYAADQRSGVIAALAVERGRVARQHRVARCGSPIQLVRAGTWLIANCLTDHALVAHPLDTSGAPLAAEPVRATIDGPFWSVAAAAAGDRVVMAAGGIEDHALERRNGGFGYIDSFLYLYELRAGDRAPRRLASVDLSAHGVVTPKGLTLAVDGDRAVVRTAGYASAALATLTWPSLAAGAPVVTIDRLVPGTTDWCPPAPGHGEALAASPLLDGWVAIAEPGAAPEVVAAGPPGPARSTESRVGEALFFTTLMAPWNRSDGKLSRFTCETCHFEAYGDGRVHFTGRGAIHSATKPLRGLFNNRPHFTRALDRTMAEMVHAEFRVANRWSGRDPWFSLAAADFPWLAAIEGVPAELSPVYLRRAFMSFLMDLSFEPNPSVRGRARFSQAERAGAALFRDRCESCHRARLVTEEPSSQVPFERWEKMIFSPQGPIVWASAEYRKTGVEPYVHPEGARTTSLRRLHQKFPHFTNGSARSLAEIVGGAAWVGDHFLHDGAPASAERLAPAEQAALLSFLELL